MIELTIVKCQTKDGATCFVPEPAELALGGRDNSLVDALRFTLPEEWAERIVTVSFQGEGGVPINAILPADGILPILGGYTAAAPRGILTVQAADGDGYKASSLPTVYTLYDHPDIGDLSELPEDRFAELIKRIDAYTDQIGNIETALDGIIAIQNELIGGDGE